MPEQQHRGCSPRPSPPCSPAQTRFQVPSALESTLQAIQDPSTCSFLLCDPVTCDHRTCVACRVQPCIPCLQLQKCSRYPLPPSWGAALRSLFQLTLPLAFLVTNASFAAARRKDRTTAPRLR